MNISPELQGRVVAQASGNQNSEAIMMRLSRIEGGVEALERLTSSAPELNGDKIAMLFHDKCGGDVDVFKEAVTQYMNAKEAQLGAFINPNMPTADYIASKTGVFGGEVHICGLTPKQADEIVKYATDNGVAGSGANKATPSSLGAWQNERLGVPAASVTVYLGHTTTCHHALFKSLGIN